MICIKCKQTAQHVLQIKQKKVFFLAVAQHQKSWKLVENLHNTLEQWFVQKKFQYVCKGTGDGQDH